MREEEEIEEFDDEIVEESGFEAYTPQEAVADRIKTWAELIDRLFKPEEGIVVDKEFALAYYRDRKKDNKELLFVRECLDFAAMLEALGLSSLAEFFTEIARIRAVTSLGDEGFAAKLLVTTIGVRKVETRTPSEKKSFWERFV